MKYSIWILLLFFVLAQAGMADQNSSAGPKIRLNSLGFFPGQIKSATIAGVCRNFKVMDAGGKAVYTGTVSGPFTIRSTNESLFIADFSAMTNPGSYYLDVPGIGKSYLFQIGDGIYNKPLQTAMLGFYLWRCGTAVSNNYDGKVFTHDACHTNDAALDYIGKKGKFQDGTGGWHDAGDYNKYTVNAGVTLGLMFFAWDNFKDKIEKLSFAVPETNNAIPDYLDELKWEMDWLLKMQYPDNSGRVSHKISTLSFGGFIMPETETTTRYYSPWGSAATADFTAMAAIAYRIFMPYDKAYAEKCIQAAKKSYAFLVKHPKDVPANLSNFSTGPYQWADPDDRLWAAAEMWNSLGDRQYLKDFEKRAVSFTNLIDVTFDWNDVKNLGFITYLFSERKGKNKALYAKISNSLISAADSIVETAAHNPYRRPLGDFYNWGCNGSVARQVLMLYSAGRFNPDVKYKNTALDALGYLFGRNFFGRSFVTGVGINPPLQPHYRRSGASGYAWPGYLVGGGWPEEISWEDNMGDYRVNEIAINWNAALVYALAWFVE